MKKVIILFFALTSLKAIALDYLTGSIKISASGMKAQEARLRLVAENIANKDSVGVTPGADPYRRQTVILQSRGDKMLGGAKVVIKKYDKDKSNFKKIYDPSHPGADKEGYVSYPNVNINIENVDSKDASKAYEANLNMLDLSKSMYSKTLDILK